MSTSGDKAEEEEELQAQFNEGELTRDDSANEFHEESELAKLKRELEKDLTSLPTAEIPPPIKERGKRPCCLGRKITC